MELNGAVGLVTGGASGLGEATVRMLVAAGAKAGIVDVPSSRGQGLADEMGEHAVFLPTDVRDEHQVAAAVDSVAEAFGRIDVCVNCAGIPGITHTLGRDGSMLPLDFYRNVVAVNLIGLFDVCRNAARVMALNSPGPDGERGVIVNVASVAGLEGPAGSVSYAAAKGGVISMTLPMARDLSIWGIRVMTICPGVFDTGMFASIEERGRERLSALQVFPKRVGAPGDFAALVKAIVENPMLNGEVIRLDAAAR